MFELHGYIYKDFLGLFDICIHIALKACRKHKKKGQTNPIRFVFNSQLWRRDSFQGFLLIGGCLTSSDMLQSSHSSAARKKGISFYILEWVSLYLRDSVLRANRKLFSRNRRRNLHCVIGWTVTLSHSSRPITFVFTPLGHMSLAPSRCVVVFTKTIPKLLRMKGCGWGINIFLCQKSF